MNAREIKRITELARAVQSVARLAETCPRPSGEPELCRTLLDISGIASEASRELQRLANSENGATESSELYERQAEQRSFRSVKGELRGTDYDLGVAVLRVAELKRALRNSMPQSSAESELVKRRVEELGQLTRQISAELAAEVGP
jgi:hypothetical protein